MDEKRLVRGRRRWRVADMLTVFTELDTDIHTG